MMIGLYAYAKVYFKTTLTRRDSNGFWYWYVKSAVPLLYAPSVRGLDA
jgi:hypothetical protein